MHGCRLGDGSRSETCRTRSRAVQIVDFAVSTPGVLGIEEEDEEEDVPLVGENITRDRGVVARCKYMAADRAVQCYQ